MVKTLLLAGADATVRTRKGALPYHFAGIQVIRTMLGDMGGAEAVPGPGDAVDMVAVLEELAMCETTVVAGADGAQTSFLLFLSFYLAVYRVCEQPCSLPLSLCIVVLVLFPCVGSAECLTVSPFAARACVRVCARGQGHCEC